MPHYVPNSGATTDGTCSGIIYSDLGTSPLYVLNGIWPASGPVPLEEDVIGGISAIIWALTLIPLAKYASDTSLLSKFP